MDPELQPAWAEEKKAQREKWRQQRIAQLNRELAELQRSDGHGV